MSDHVKRIDELADALERMWAGGGDYGVYTVAIERDKVRKLLHELLSDHRLQAVEKAALPQPHNPDAAEGGTAGGCDIDGLR